MKKFFSKISARFRFAQGLAIGLGATSLFAYATVTITSFTSGTTILSSDINTNFSNLKSAVEELQDQTGKFIGTLGGPLSLTCVSTPSFPGDFTNPNFNLEDGSVSDSFSIPTTGMYEIEGDHTTTSGSFLNVQVELLTSANAHISNEIVNHLSPLRRKYTAGQLIRIWYGCQNKGGKNPSVIMNNNVSYMIIKKNLIFRKLLYTAEHS